MSEGPVRDPRWGQEGRQDKAHAILATLQLHCKQDLAGGLWLDVGCGSGGMAGTLAERVKQIVGVDPESWERWATFERQHANLKFKVGSYADLPELLGPESVDVVVCNQVYEHVDDPKALLKAIHIVLRANGICYFAGPNLLWPVEPHVFWPFVHWMPRNFSVWLMKACRARYAHCLDAWSWPYWKLVRAFREGGFRYAGAMPERLCVQALQGRSKIIAALARAPRSLVSVLHPLAPGFIFVLRKSPASKI